MIFLSDNGPVDGDILTSREWEFRNHIPLKGNKGEVFDNGIRVPLFIRWPGQFKPRIVDDALTSVMDIFPTLMHLAGAASNGKKTDGQSLVPLLMQSSPDTAWSQRTLYHTTAAPEWTKRGGEYWTPAYPVQDKSIFEFGDDGRWAIRSGRYKLVHYFGNEYAFDMVDDPYESQPLNSPVIEAQLRAMLHSWWTEMVNDLGSFTMPTFQIGWYGSPDSKILAMAAVQTSVHVSLHSHEASGWQNQGASAVYSIRIVTPGVYRVFADLDALVNLEMVVTIDCVNAQYQTSGRVGKKGFIGHIVIGEAHDLCLLEVQVVSVGKNVGQVSMKTLTLSYLEE